jgi:hypothetical protein
MLPEGWFGSGDVSGIQLANREAVLGEDFGGDVQPGDQAITAFAVAQAELSGIGLTEEAGLSDLADLMLAFMIGGEDAPSSVSEIAEAELGGRPAVRFEAQDDEVDGIVYVYMIAPTVFGVGVIGSYPGELAAAEESLLPILDSVQYGLSLDESFEAEDSALAFLYPTDWSAEALDPTVVVAANDPAAIGADELQPGQYLIGVLGIDPASIEGVDLSGEDIADFTGGFAARLVEDSENNPVVGDPIVLDTEYFQGNMALVRITSDIADGGLVIVYTGEVAYAVIFSGVPGEGWWLAHTALLVANSVRYTPAQ